MSMADDLIEIILLNTPVKSLIRFKTVSKSWNQMISNPDFCHMYSSVSRQNRPRFLAHEEEEELSCCLLNFHDGEFEFESTLQFPTRDPIECWCNGIVLLSRDNGAAYTLWNPHISVYTTVEFPYKRFYVEACGLCYDKVHDDYKIVVIGRESCTVFSHKKNRWSEPKVLPDNIIEIESFYKTDFNGHMYWICVSETGDGSCKSSLLCFDCGDEKFRDIVELPQCLLRNYGSGYLVLHGYFSREEDLSGLFTWRNNLCFYDYMWSEHKIGIWSLVGGYWEETLTMTFPKFNGIFPIDDDMIIISWFTGNDEEIKYAVYSVGEARFVGEETNFYSLFPCPEAFFVPTPALLCSEMKT